MSSPLVLEGSLFAVSASIVEGSVKSEGNPFSHYLHLGSSEDEDEVVAHLEGSIAGFSLRLGLVSLPMDKKDMEEGFASIKSGQDDIK